MQKTNVTKLGRSFAVRIPRPLAESIHFKPGDEIELTPAGEGLLLKKNTPARKKYGLKDILSSFAPAGTRPEADFGPPQGKEI